jgi:fluoroacetyl-CoA thioesterase
MTDVGATADITFVVDESATAVALGSGDLLVLGTPKVVALCEEAAVAAIDGSIDAGATTVGTSISLDHLAPTALGGSVIASATLVVVDRRRLEFNVSASEGDRIVARGTHTRIIVDSQRFLEGLDVG